MKELLVLFLLSLTLLSCEFKTKSTNNTATQKNTDSITKNNSQEPNGIPEEKDIFMYSKTGKTVTEFIPNPDVYTIQDEVRGDLNEDGLEDIAVVIHNIKIKNEPRPMLILLQNKDNSYRLDKISNFVMPTEYTDTDLQMYSSETFSIEKGVLKINLYGMGGPIGNTFSHFKYFQNDLILTYIETYNIGAGSWQNLYYDLRKGELTEQITNTMKEEMPTTENTFKLKKEKHLFETASPNDIISEVYKQINSNW